MPSKSCFNCGYRALNPQECPVLGIPYGPTACPFHEQELTYCAICNQVIPGRNVTFTQAPDSSWKAICEKCLPALGTCRTCSKGSTCDFETNPSPIPKAVQKRIQQGNQIIVTTEKNPSLIEITCKKNCKCWNTKIQECNKEFGCCENYEEVL